MALVLNSQASKPKKGKGERFFDCPHYESCLNFAAIQNWKSFNCESCLFFKSEVKDMPTIPKKKETPASTGKKEDARICEDCNKNKTISPKHSLCASCMARRSNKSRPKKKVPASPKRKETTQNKAIPEKPQQDHDTALTIEFGKYASVLSEIKKIAEEEVRSIDLQIIYILKRYLSKDEVSKSP